MFFVNILSVIGAIGLFIFGMKLMSESLQKIAGNKLRSVLNYVTSSTTKAILSGVLITALVQASSVVTVMLVSFVNAGLLTLTESIGIIMGANIGTTLKIWLIATLGFKANIGFIALPLIGVSFPFIFSKKRKKRLWGTFIIGIALLFLGLDFLNYMFNDVLADTKIISLLSKFSGLGFGSILLFVFSGIIISAIVQSSSATVALTIVMCANGWIPLELGLAMVLGENIGTTVTANIAAIIANTAAKRAALSHTLFNVIGVIWALLLFNMIVSSVDFLTIKISGSSPLVDANASPIALAVFHTMFNLTNTILLAGFIPLIARIATKLIPGIAKKESKKLQFFESNFSTSELMFIQAKIVIIDFAKKGKKIFGLIPEILDEKDEAIFDTLMNRIIALEENIDSTEQEIAAYLSRVSENEMSASGLKNVKSMQRIVKEIESVGDCAYHMAKSIKQKNTEKIWFTQDLRDNLKSMFALINKSFEILIINLEKDYDRVSIDKAQLIELQINKIRSEMLTNQRNNHNISEQSYKSGLVFTDIVSSCEKIADHIFNINESIIGLK